ncbi:indolepyruvate ferredoxin oxidoreductase family protein [Bordetella avium]|uniref:indolepyruvate ferredoxin oxidoreductase family protein n=1 Tax=Bordetella avium TaxID=521 RepID=UPI000E0CB686|nr:indolepyruvate ferredoxin oxidoreductase family protein [Bordetella avium]AZY53798.1 indolepyruvate ferredoxin oxidoreductase [Bordetella avium]RIQ15430.1 indolepyruvate ferredoxin oxidoreductase family protein [Bordetella avium]RIQ38460.1 indolepyruvate ferredoxin oxidoreductase family protein [Bordetella avium]RIQ42999.1 indolepyruvate ferredoxin oxidoreductase family protein [Bordetella avium]RIQ44066.1 indolepyruvate ferredoxin oxidoreductase family protein [Bordetella avium]
MNAPLTPAQRAALQSVHLDDKFTLETGRAWMSGIHALVRLPMMQRERDARAGLNTAGFISGYRGSPLGGVDQNMWKAAKYLKQHHIEFQPGVNEDLAATAVWGSQQVNLFPGAKYDGVFGMWYGKGPGVDRCGDVFKHANAAGTSRHGGVLVVAGDDHPAKSSTLPHQSDHILKACMIPVLFPSSVQEVLDFGLHGWAMSRYAGVWVGLKTITDIVEVSASVEVDSERVRILLPEDFTLPPDGLNIRLPDTPLQQEARLLDYKLYAALAYARANKLNRELWSVPNDRARFGIITSGKAYLDTRQALADLGLSEAVCQHIGLRLFKVGMVWPLEATGMQQFAEGLDEILVIEEKRQVIEYQLKEELFSWIGTGKKIPRVVGKFDDKDGGEWSVPQGNWLLPAHYEFSPAMVAKAVGARLLRLELPEAVRAGIEARLAFIAEREKALAKPRLVVDRKPWFCSGCPHNTSTRLPDGSRGLAGIGCHYMVTWMGRNTQVFTQMGGEGVPWIGQAPFTEEKHVFANLGDGTYFHSGLLAIRAAVAARVPITYKILFNDAVAMTGGQPVDGPISVPMITQQMVAEGIEKIVVVTDEPEKYQGISGLAPGVPVRHRDDLDSVMRELREHPGVSVLIYDQTCATEKRRRRKRNAYPDPARRVLINERVCEGCGDCSEKSHCLSVEPLETEFGRKRSINQSSCNKDFSCLKGFCPSFVTVEGGKLRRPQALAQDGDIAAGLPAPQTAAIKGHYGIFIAGVGGTGVVTIGQLIGMAAHLEGKGCSVLDMAGLAQKGGAVYSHVVLALTPGELMNTRVAMGEADLVLAGDLVVGSSQEAVARMRPDRSHALINTDVAPTAAFVHNPDWTLPGSDLQADLGRACASVDRIDAAALAVGLLGDAIYANPLMMGYAYQKGWLPLSEESLLRAIELNGQQVPNNQAAFAWGRRAAHNLAAVQSLIAQGEMELVELRRGEPAVVDFKRPATDLEHIVEMRRDVLTAYQNAAYAQRYTDLVTKVAQAERAATGTTRLAEAVARNYFKLMAYKDEYEVARLYSDGEFIKKVGAQFEGDWKLKFYLAPPLSAKRDAEGHLQKRAYGPGMLRVFSLLARLRFLRGTAFDIFGRTDERRAERELIREYEQHISAIIGKLSRSNLEKAVELASIPQEIRGYGHVKEAAMARAAQKRERLLQEFSASVVSIDGARAA